MNRVQSQAAIWLRRFIMIHWNFDSIDTIRQSGIVSILAVHSHLHTVEIWDRLYMFLNSPSLILFHFDRAYWIRLCVVMSLPLSFYLSVWTKKGARKSGFYRCFTKDRLDKQMSCESPQYFSFPFALSLYLCFHFFSYLRVYCVCVCAFIYVRTIVLPHSIENTKTKNIM